MKHKKKRQEKDCNLRLTGKVTEASTAGSFVVVLGNGLLVNATPCGKLRQFNIQIVPGDTVELETSVYDCSRGRITKRL